jgi:LAO/AO transport system kinase
MERLSASEAAYIRPTPSSGTLGGVAEKTREAMLVCEAAGYDLVIVETVGVGQSETAVSGMTDLFVLLQLPNAGDELQAIKRGVMELADFVVVNKADLDANAAARAEVQIAHAVREQVQVLRASALTGEGLEAFWQRVRKACDERRASGAFAERRQQQSLAWMWDLVHARLLADFHAHAAVRAALPQALADVTSAHLAPSVAARDLIRLFERDEIAHEPP